MIIKKHNNQKNQTGSAILIVMFTISVLSICTIVFWQSSALFQDISIERLLYEQKYRATEAGLNYVIEICSKHFDSFIEMGKNENTPITGNKTFEMETDYWKMSEYIMYKNKMHILPDANLLKLKSELFDSNNKKVFTLSCELLKNKKKGAKKELEGKKQLVVKNWKICE